MKFFVIEHETRGFYTGSEYEPTDKGYQWIPHFAWSIKVDNERVEHLFSQAEIDREMNKIPVKVRGKCKVKEYDT